MAGDFDLSGSEILDGVVGAAVAELELVGLGAEGQSQNLVAQADAEYRHTLYDIRLEISGFIRLLLQALDVVGIVFRIPVCAKSGNGDAVQGCAAAMKPEDTWKCRRITNLRE